MQIQATWCSGEWDTSGYSDCIKMRISHPEIYQLLCVEQAMAMIYQYIYIYIICIWCVYIYKCMIYIYIYDISRDFIAIFRGHVERRVTCDDSGSFRLPADFPRPHRTGIEAYIITCTIYICRYLHILYIHINTHIYIYVYIYMYI